MVLVAAGLGGWAIDRAVTGSSGGPAGGHLLVYLSSGQLARAAPDGSGAVPYTSLGFIGGGGFQAAPDNSALLSGAGDVVTLRAGKPVSHSTALFAPISQHDGIITSLSPFADGSADVVFGQGAQSGAPGDPLIVPTGGGRVDALGPGSDFEGDPTQDAAWVAAPASDQPQGAQQTVDTEIDHRRPGGASTPLITAAQVAQDLGRDTSTPLGLYTVPDPSGRDLLIGADDADTGDGVGAVIVTRAGTRVAKLPITPLGAMQWSPSGQYLLVSDLGHLIITSATGVVLTSLTLPARAQLLQTCAWSPDGTRVACDGSAARGQSIDDWIVVDRPRASVTPYPSTEVPLLWTAD